MNNREKFLDALSLEIGTLFAMAFLAAITMLGVNIVASGHFHISFLTALGINMLIWVFFGIAGRAFLGSKKS